MVFTCLLLTFLAAGSSVSACTSQLKSTLISFSILLALLLSGCYLLADHLTDDGINEAVLYHLTMDMSGTGYGDFATPMALTLAYILISVGISLATYRWSFTNKRARATQYRWIAGIIMVFIAIAANPGTTGLINLAAMMIQTGSPQDRPEQYFAVDPETVSLDGKNLIYLYVESLELNYLNKDLFPGLTPNLQRLRNEATDFTNIRGMWGTSWTIAGMVSSQCGIPLISPGENNSTSGAGQFLPKAVCMGDILKSQGYALHYMGGAALTFAGKGLFYKDHGFDHIEGVSSLLTKTPNQDYRNWWGLYDDSLYALLTKRIERLASLDQPFALFGLTLDTHHPKGNVSSSCRNSLYLDGSNPILNAVHCADQLIAKFVSDLRNNDLLKNTILVIASDHLALPNTAAARLKSEPRKNLMLVFNEALPTGEVTKPGTTLDMGPTLINLMGGTLPGLGFGRDLMADVPTLAGTYLNLAKYLRTHRGFIRTLWDFPQIFLGAQLDLEAKTIQLEEQSLKLPIALKLNNSLEVEDVMFDFSGRTRLQERIEKLDVHQRFLWVDTCQEIAPLLAANKRTFRADYCLAYGTLGAGQVFVHPLEQSFTVAFKEISSYFENIEVSQDQASNRRRRLATYRMTGLMDVEAISTTAPLTEQIIIRSAGGPNHTSSYIKSQSSAESYKVRRGVTLFGVKNDGAIQSLVRVDTCSIAIQDGSQTPPLFSEYIDRENKIFDHFVIVSHDSALCRKNKLDLILKGLPLEAWSRLSIREPYIAVIANDKKLAEIKGARDSSLSAVLVHSATRK
jgi:phosphoglycerol transferase